MNKIIENQIKFIEVVKESMHECAMENVRKIKIKLENIWIDLIRSIYAPYNVLWAWLLRWGRFIRQAFQRVVWARWDGLIICLL